MDFKKLRETLYTIANNRHEILILEMAQLIDHIIGQKHNSITSDLKKSWTQAKVWRISCLHWLPTSRQFQQISESAGYYN